MTLRLGKHILAVCILSLCSGCDGRYWFGDSLTGSLDPSCSPAHYFNVWRDAWPELGLPYMQWMGQPAMTLVGFEAPPWLRPLNHMQGIVLELGANDVLRGTDHSVYRAKTQQIVDQFHQQGFDTVECIIIEDYPADLEGVCDITYTVPLYLEDSPDGLHMGCEGSEKFAKHIGRLMYEGHSSRG